MPVLAKNPLNSPVFFSSLQGRREISIHFAMEISQHSAFLHVSPRCFAQVPVQQLQQGCFISHSHRKKNTCIFGIWPEITGERNLEGCHWYSSQLTLAVQSLRACPAFLLQDLLTREMPQNHIRRLFGDFKTSTFFYVRSFFNGNSSIGVFGTHMMGFSPLSWSGMVLISFIYTRHLWHWAAGTAMVAFGPRDTERSSSDPPKKTVATEIQKW